jgi:hypothetical protein
MGTIVANKERSICGALSYNKFMVRERGLEPPRTNVH